MLKNIVLSDVHYHYHIFNIFRVFGIRLGTVIYAVLVVIGQLIFAAGTYLNTLWFMLLGRLIFG